MMEQLFTVRGKKREREGEDGTIGDRQEEETREKMNRGNGDGENRRTSLRGT